MSRDPVARAVDLLVRMQGEEPGSEVHDELLAQFDRVSLTEPERHEFATLREQYLAHGAVPHEEER